MLIPCHNEDIDWRGEAGADKAVGIVTFNRSGLLSVCVTVLRGVCVCVHVSVYVRPRASKRVSPNCVCVCAREYVRPRTSKIVSQNFLSVVSNNSMHARISVPLMHTPHPQYAHQSTHACAEREREREKERKLVL